MAVWCGWLAFNIFVRLPLCHSHCCPVRHVLRKRPKKTRSHRSYPWVNSGCLCTNKVLEQLLSEMIVSSRLSSRSQLFNDVVSQKVLVCSKTCLERPPIVSGKSGLLRQVEILDVHSARISVVMRTFWGYTNGIYQDRDLYRLWGLSKQVLLYTFIKIV